jgi:hypothetical protein
MKKALGPGEYKWFYFYRVIWQDNIKEIIYFSETNML